MISESRIGVMNRSERRLKGPEGGANPNGIAASSPGLRVRELPWERSETCLQPQRGCGQEINGEDATPLGLEPSGRANPR